MEERKRDIGARPKSKNNNSVGVRFDRYHALIISIEQYTDPAIPNLKTPRNDGKTFGELLINRCGFLQSNVKWISKAKNATWERIDQLLRRYIDTLSSKDSLIIYFAGHGEADEKTQASYWLPSDAIRSRKNTWFKHSDLRDIIREIKARHVAVISDSCFAGRLLRSGNEIPRPLTGTKWVSDAIIHRSRMALTSGDDHPVSDEGAAGQSIFNLRLTDFIRTGKEQAFTLGQAAFAIQTRVQNQRVCYGPLPDLAHDNGELVLFRKKSKSNTNKTPEATNETSSSPTTPQFGFTASQADDSQFADQQHAKKDKPLDSNENNKAESIDVDIETTAAQATPTTSEKQEKSSQNAPTNRIGHLLEQNLQGSDGIKTQPNEQVNHGNIDDDFEQFKKLRFDREAVLEFLSAGFKMQQDLWRKAAFKNQEIQLILALCDLYRVHDGADTQAGIEKIEQLANDGFDEAQFQFGYELRYGRYVEKNLEAGAKWVLRAAQHGHVKAQGVAGWCYQNGIGLPQNETKAFEFYKQSAEQEDAVGQHNLGHCYYYGHGIPQDYSEAAKWFEKAAGQEDAVGQYNLGNCYYYGHGVPQDYSEAAKWFEKAAVQEDASGQYTLGHCYYYGHGVPQDYSAAAKWFEKAAEQEVASGQYNLGQCYYYGHGVPQDYSEATKWYQKAAEQEHAVAQYNLGHCYYEGLGAPQDYSEAAKWFEKAAEQEYASGQYNLGHCYYYGHGVPQDYSEAAKWFEKAAERGDVDAQYKLAVSLRSGLGVDKNNKLARVWLRRASGNGHSLAKQLLKREANSNVCPHCHEVQPVSQAFCTFCQEPITAECDESIPVKILHQNEDSAHSKGASRVDMTLPVLHPIAGVVWAAFWGTPLAAGIVLTINYCRMKQTFAAVSTLFGAVALTAAFIGIGMSLPDHSASSSIILIQIATVYAIARGMQQNKIEKHKSTGGRIASAWWSVGIGVVTLVGIYATTILTVVLFQDLLPI